MRMVCSCEGVYIMHVGMEGRRMTGTREWSIEPGAHFGIAFGLCASFRKALAESATHLCETPIPQFPDVERQAHVLAWVGRSRPGRSVPGSLLELVLDEFPRVRFPPLLLEGWMSVDEIEVCVFRSQQPYVHFAAAMGRLLSAYATPLERPEDVVLYLPLGMHRHARQDGEVPCRYVVGDAVPERLIVGFWGAAGVFVPLAWRSVTGSRTVRGRTLRTLERVHQDA